MSARPPAEILRELQGVMAELTAALQEPDPKSDVSPKLEQALRATRQTRAYMPSTAEVPIKSHEEIRAAARAYKPADYKYESENPERLKDYTPAHDPDWPPDSAWMGTGDHKLVE